MLLLLLFLHTSKFLGEKTTYMSIRGLVSGWKCTVDCGSCTDNALLFITRSQFVFQLLIVNDPPLHRGPKGPLNPSAGNITRAHKSQSSSIQAYTEQFCFLPILFFPSLFYVDLKHKLFSI